MKSGVPLLFILILLSAALLLIVKSGISTATMPSPFLIAAAIVSTVALFGAVFSLYTERRRRTRNRGDSELYWFEFRRECDLSMCSLSFGVLESCISNECMQLVLT